MSAKPSTRPYPEFPLFPDSKGQWRKDIRDSKLKRAILYRFGPWSDDPKGERALAEYMAAKDAIANGTYRIMRAELAVGQYTVTDLARDYLADRASDVKSGKLTQTSYLDIIAEVNDFIAWINGKVGAAVAVTGLILYLTFSRWYHAIADRKQEQTTMTSGQSDQILKVTRENKENEK